MKKVFNKIVAMMLATVALTSCLKDDTMILDPEKAGSNIIEFQNVSEIAVHGSTTPLYVLSYEISSTPTVIPVTVSYSGAEMEAPKDIKVNIALAAQSVIDQYNTEQSKSYQMMPSSWYTLSSTSVTIPKGQKTAKFNISVKTDMIDLSAAYALPLKLSSSDATVSSNFGTALFNIGAKNPYDGIYTYTTSAITSLVPNANKTVSLITASANTVNLSPGLLGTYSNAVSYTIDAATKAVTVTCPSLGVQTPQDTRSNWDASKKVLTVYWKQGNGARTFEEVFTFKSARP